LFFLVACVDVPFKDAHKSQEFEVQDPAVSVSNASQRVQEWKLTVSATVLCALGMIVG